MKGSTKNKCIFLSILLLAFWLSANLAQANVSALSHGLKKKISAPVERPQKKRFKARAAKISGHKKLSKNKKIKTAVLWHAPPYRKLAIQLSPQEESIRDLKAMEALSSGAELKYPQIAKAKKILEKKDSAIKLIAGEVLNQISIMTLNIDLSKFRRIRSSDDATELVSKINKYLYTNYLVYKKHYFINDMRNPIFIKEMQLSKANLESVTGTEALMQVDQIFLGQRQAKEEGEVHAYYLSKN